jgi:alpha-tubulin suppressor-like RCC1 family protein
MKKTILLLSAVLAVFAGCGMPGVLESAGDVTAARAVTTSQLTGVVKISAGLQYSFALCSNGDLYATGSDLYGQLGTADVFMHTNKWVKVLSNIKDAVAGPNGHSLALDMNGLLFVAGRNDHYQLGTGDQNNVYTWKPLRTGVAAIAAGYFHSLILTTQGTVMAAGENQFGQLGLGHQSDRTHFVTSFSGASAIACGANHSLLIRAGDGNVLGTGSNYSGELGLDDQDLNIQVVIEWTPSTDNGSVKAITAGYSFSFLLKSNGKLYACGNNQWHQLGLANTDGKRSWTYTASGIAEISAGRMHSLAKKTFGKIYGAGSNEDGQLGLGAIPEVSGWTYTAGGIPGAPAAGASTSIAAGFTHSLVIKLGKPSHLLFGTGSNQNGELGLGDYNDRDYWDDD